MLVLSRKRGERIMIGNNIEVTIMGVHGGTVRLGLEAPKEVAIHREEVFRRVQDELSQLVLTCPQVWNQSLS
jgi:carbon storage regulator